MRGTFTGLKGLLDRNLGRCAYCMGAALVAALAAWAVWFGLWLAWPAVALSAFAIILPAGLGLLWLAHLAAYTGRALAALRSEYSVGGSRFSGERRTVLWMVGAAVGLGLVAAAWLPVQAFAAGQACGDGHCPDRSPNCCRSRQKCCNGIWACTKTGTCHHDHTSARQRCGQDGIVIACG